MNRLLAILAGAIASVSAHAAGPAPTLLDPYVPPEVVKKAAAAPAHRPSSGAELRSQVERKLRAAFDRADVERRGSITLAQARAAGLGRIARDFARIDASGSGRVTFDDYRRFLHAQGASTSLLEPVPGARAR